MIINIRGTGGAGKSHLVRSIMALYPATHAFHIEGRKRPMWYRCDRDSVSNPEKNLPFGPSLFVPGHYETPTGGCDTISTPDEVYTLVRRGATEGADVLYEGIMVGDDVRRCAELRDLNQKVLVIALNTPIDECLAGIQQRRDTRGDDRPLSPKNTISRADRLKKSMIPRLKDAGVDCRWLSRAEAFETVKKELGLG